MSYTSSSAGDPAADLQAFNASVGAALDAVRSGPVADLLNRFVYPPVALQTARLLTAGTDLDLSITYAGDTNLFRLAMLAGTTYWFNAEGSSTGRGTISDPDLRLLGTDGVTQLVFGQSNGVGGNSFISYTPATTGTYYMEAGSSGASTGSYFLTERVADDYPSNPATSGILVAGGSVVGTYDFVADTDWFKTTFTAGTTYRFDMESTPTDSGTQIQPRLKLFGNQGASQLAFDGNASGEPKASISYTAATTGTYYVSAESFGSNVGTYRLSEAVISGATSSSAAPSPMSFVAASDDTSPAASGTVVMASQPAGKAAAGVLLDPSGGVITPDQFFASAGSVIQPQYTAGDATQQSAASLMINSPDYTTAGVLPILYPLTT